MLVFQIHDDVHAAPPVTRGVGGGWTVLSVSMDRAEEMPLDRPRVLLVDVNIKQVATALRVKALLRRASPSAVRLFACRPGDHHTAIQAAALGSARSVARPVDDRELSDALGALDPQAAPAGEPLGALTGGVALDRLFRSLLGGSRLTLRQIDGVVAGICDEVHEVGVAPWLAGVRTHHLGTYQHCLLVTGIACGYARALGMSRRDETLITLSALLHDVGKAKVPRELLDKPGALTPAELAIVRTHPVEGHAYLVAHSDMPAEILDAVRHHHELLDGSGYPDRLAGPEIADLTRIITICDVFGALSETRPYKPVMPAAEAYQVLVGMAEAGRLEHALVKAFGGMAAALDAAPSGALRHSPDMAATRLRQPAVRRA